MGNLNSWDIMYDLLLVYKDREGHCNVPAIHKEDGKNLGEWLSNQRQAMKKGKLDSGKEKQLEEIGVVWDIRNQQWENYFNLLVKYKDCESHCNILQFHKEDGENLGIWLSYHRTAMKEGKLNVDKQKQLEKLGVVW